MLIFVLARILTVLLILAVYQPLNRKRGNVCGLFTRKENRQGGHAEQRKRGGNSIQPLNRVTRPVGDNDIYARRVYDVCGPPPMDHSYTLSFSPLDRGKERENSPRGGSVP